MFERGGREIVAGGYFRRSWGREWGSEDLVRRHNVWSVSRRSGCLRIKLDKCTRPFFTSARTYKTRPRAEEDHHPKNYIHVAREKKQTFLHRSRSFVRSS